MHYQAQGDVEAGTSPSFPKSPVEEHKEDPKLDNEALEPQNDTISPLAFVGPASIVKFGENTKDAPDEVGRGAPPRHHSKRWCQCLSPCGRCLWSAYCALRDHVALVVPLVAVAVTYHAAARFVLNQDDEWRDEGECLDEAELEAHHILLPASLAVCDCIPRTLRDAYYNPLTIAVSAMLVPSMLLGALVLRKNCLSGANGCRRILAAIAGGERAQAEQQEDEDVMEDDPDKFVQNVSRGMDVFCLFLNTCVAILAIRDYFMSSELKPTGDGFCWATHAV